MFAIFDEWRRAEAVLNEIEHPTGPDLKTWTVEAIREWPVRTDLQWKHFDADIERLRKGNREALESAVRYLEADPWYPGTGWIKQKLLRYILRMDASGYEDRLRRVTLMAARSVHARRELRLYARLAHRVMDEDLRQSLEAVEGEPGPQSGTANYILRGGPDPDQKHENGMLARAYKFLETVRRSRSS